MSSLLDRLQSALAGRYTVERELGRGGMATVYLAQDLKHGRPVAIKVLRPELAAALGGERFLREIQLTANLQHPHILGLLDSGEVAGIPYYIMPFVEGESLRDRLNRERQLSLVEAVRIAREVADALDYAHAHGLIHRDIKPENILLSGGHAVVADFGIARAVEQAGGTKLTETGLAVGTPDYMSPEQAAGEAGLDGRTDEYSLGCVLYEMLAGHPPFLGRNPQEIRARHALDPVPPLRSARATVSDELDAVLRRALAKQPADRFATTAEFVAALDAPTATPTGIEQAPSRSRHRYQRLAWALVILGGIAGAIALLRRKPPVALDANLVAVAPFEVLDPSLTVWREGMGDVLSRYLDGTGPLSTISPTVVFKHWIGRPDRGSAEALGQRTGAGLVVFGNMIPKGGDSVVVRASVLRLTEGGAIDEVEVTGGQDRIGELADSLGLGILEVLGRSRPIGAVRHASLGAHSLPALKAFLRGEQLYRRGSWDSALVQYDRALQLDSVFALADRRMAAILWFDPPTAHSYRPSSEYAFRAERLNRGLGAGDSLLIVGLASMMRLNGEEPAYFQRYRAASDALEEAVRRSPTDPEAWYFLGEFRYHWASNVATPWQDQLEPFDRGLALDSSFSTLYEHVVPLAIRLGQAEKAKKYVAAYLALDSGAIAAEPLRLEAMALDPEQATNVARFIDSVTAWQALWNPQFELSLWPDSAETAIRIARSFPSARRDYAGAPDFVRNPMVHRRVLASTLAARGHLREAYLTSPERSVQGWANQFPRLAPFGAVPTALADTVFGELLRTDSLWSDGSVVLGFPWWFAQNDSTSFKLLATRADSLAHRRDAVFRKYALEYLGDEARAYLALLRGDSATALTKLEALPDSLCLIRNCFFRQLTRARLLAANGRDRDAEQLLTNWIHTAAGVWFVVGTLERGRVAERLKERDPAIEHYSYVVHVWRNADQELEPYVSEARAGLERLTTEPRP